MAANDTRRHKTMPPPPMHDYADEVMAHVRDLRDAAARILANANEIEDSLKARGMR